ncbi:hypothetical protein ACPPVQ_04560 [Diaminobutyricibacter sp. McL0618]|uniref:hypothetical protein n=1 Tax=Leifsonia sp. McL0618 TaxID=3415677 RepID=UPI003CFBA3D8
MDTRTAPAAAQPTQRLSAAPAVRAFLAVAALGAGLLHAALAPDAPPLLLGLLVLIAASELAWAVATLARERPPFFEVAPALALAPLVLWAGLAVAGASATTGTVIGLSLAPMGAASLLDVAIAVSTAVLVRRRKPASQQTGAVRFVLALILSASAVSFITIPALGLTEAGVVAVTVHHHH